MQITKHNCHIFMHSIFVPRSNLLRIKVHTKGKQQILMHQRNNSRNALSNCCQVDRGCKPTQPETLAMSIKRLLSNAVET